jgi:hypothetical protein
VSLKRSDANLPRSWSRHSTKKGNKVITPNAKNHARAKGQEANSKDIDDPKLQDFLQVMQPHAKSKLWGNDTTIVSNDGNNQATLNKETNGISIANHLMETWIRQWALMVSPIQEYGECSTHVRKGRELRMMTWRSDGRNVWE